MHYVFGEHRESRKIGREARKSRSFGKTAAQCGVVKHFARRCDVLQESATFLAQGENRRKGADGGAAYFRKAGRSLEKCNVCWRNGAVWKKCSIFGRRELVPCGTEAGPAFFKRNARFSVGPDISCKNATVSENCNIIW